MTGPECRPTVETRSQQRFLVITTVVTELMGEVTPVRYPAKTFPIAAWESGDGEIKADADLRDRHGLPGCHPCRVPGPVRSQCRRPGHRPPACGDLALGTCPVSRAGLGRSAGEGD